MSQYDVHILDSIFLRREDQEYSQSLARIAITGISLFAAILYGKGEDIMLAIWLLAFYWLFSVAWSIFVRHKPGKFPARRCVTIVGDIAAASAGIYLAGNLGAAFYPVYLWVIVGNGIRFGLSYLYFAMFLTIPCFSYIVFFGEFWINAHPVGIGLLAGILILPLFYGMLLRQIRHLNDELSNELEKTDYAAKHDALTRLPNRSYFYSTVRKRIDRPLGGDRRFAIIFVDLDGFKDVNDALGHHKGDDLLLETATRLGRMLRKGDMAARLGGDEFALIMPGIVNRGADVENVLQRLLDSISEVSSDLEGELRISASMGVSFFPDHGDIPEVLIRKADLAMYEAKRKGKNQYVLFSDDLLQ